MIRSMLAIAAALAGALLGGCTVSGGVFSARTYVYTQEVAPGATVDAGDYNTLAGDGRGSCHTLKPAEVSIVEPPAYGGLSVVVAPRPVKAGAGTPEAACVGLTTASSVVRYRAPPDFRGEDRATYQVVHADGDVEIYTKIFRVE